MTVHFFGSPKKTTVKIKQIRFFENRKKKTNKFFRKMTVHFFGSPKKTTVKIKQIRFFKIRKNINK